MSIRHLAHIYLNDTYNLAHITSNDITVLELIFIELNNCLYLKIHLIYFYHGENPHSGD